VNSVEGEFQSSGHTYLVEHAARVVLHPLLAALPAHTDIPVARSLEDGINDLQFAARSGCRPGLRRSGLVDAAQRRTRLRTSSRPIR